MVTIITFKYTLLINLRIGNLIMFLRKRRRANKHICEIIIATTIVTSGKIPFFNNIYDIGKLSRSIPPTTI